MCPGGIDRHWVALGPTRARNSVADVATRHWATHMDLSPLPLTLSVEDLAALLRCSPETVASNASRAPEKLPPAIRTGGRRLLWITADVMTWLEAHRAGPAPTAPVAPLVALATAPPRKRGRPRKAEQLARRAGGAR